MLSSRGTESASHSERPTDLDPEEAQALVDPALALMIESVRHFDGYIVQWTGDGIFALFGAPVAREEHPQRALHAALRMQEELRNYGARLRAEGRSPIEIWVGVNTGEVMVRSIQTGAREMEYTPIGHTTNFAARLQTIASTGSIVISQATERLVAAYFTLKPLGSAKIRGLRDPIEVFEVAGVGPLRTRLQASATRGLSKFVGRTRETEKLLTAFEAVKRGHGQLVAAVADAGVGKSRLFHEFKAIAGSSAMTLEAYSVSHGKANKELLQTLAVVGKEFAPSLVKCVAPQEFAQRLEAMLADLQAADFIYEGRRPAKRPIISSTR